jgi:hypothetical protein
MLRHFLGTGKFFEGVGLSKIFDAKDQRAVSANERDRFYYANLLSEIEHHFKSSRQPLFAYLETMATHGTYTFTYMPEVEVPGGGPSTHPEMHDPSQRSMPSTFLISERCSLKLHAFRSQMPTALAGG